MNWQTYIARRAFPKDQIFMAKRKLAYLVWALVVGVIASAFFTAGVWLVQNQQRVSLQREELDTQLGQEFVAIQRHSCDDV